MQKIGVIHYNFPRDWSLDRFLRYAADVGFPFVELSIADVWDEKSDQPEKSAETVRGKVRELGLRVSALSAGNDFVQGDADAIRRQVERMGRIAGLARILDEEAVIRSEGGQPKDGVPPEKWEDAMVECFTRCVPFVDRQNVGIAIDNHGVVSNDGDLLFRVIERVGHPRVGTNLDTMNYRWYGHDLATCDRYYEMMASHALHTHIKDGFGSRQDYRGAALGEGEIHLRHALDCLRRTGYQGVYCAEYEGPEVDGGTGYRKCFEWLAAAI